MFRVVDSYDLDTLGAPFKVTLKNSVSVWIDPQSGEERIKIPDPMGLTRAVVRCRVLDPIKLSGEEIRFVRKALDLPANKLAAFLDCTPEHYSRCEGEGRALSAAAEKQLRLFAFGATLFPDPAMLLDIALGHVSGPKSPKPLNRNSEKMAKGFFSVFMAMKIQPFRNIDEPVEYVLCRSHSSECCPAGLDPDDDWRPLPKAA